METLKKIVTNQYFPAGAVLTAVLLFWVVGMLGGLSLLNNSQPPLTTLTWMLFVYSAAVLTPLAGLLAALDLLRRWRSNRNAASASVAPADAAAPPTVPASEPAPQSTTPAPQPTAAAPKPAQPAPKPRPGRNEAA